LNCEQGALAASPENCVSYIWVLPSDIGKEKEEAVMADRDGGGFLWFLAGLGVGAVVGVLYAPRSGDETREVLRTKAQEGSEKARQQARRAKEQAGEWVDRGRDALNNQKEQFRSAYEAGRQAYNETTTAGAEKTKNL
jgi:gas vesicle protein